MKTLGIIGLGAMGKPIAHHFLSSGYRLYTTVRSEKSRLLAESMGITVLPTPADLTEHTNTILLLVSNYAQCHELLEGPSGVFSSLTEGTVILSSTIAPEDAEALAAACPNGVSLLDAPVSGGVTGAESGTLITMVAGSRDAFDACSDLFGLYSKKAVYVSETPGRAQALKAVNQMLVSIHMAATAEAAALSNALGLDLSVVYDTISECAGNSNIFQSRMPKLIRQDYSSRASLETLEKDTGICIGLAQKAGVPCYLTTKCHELFCNTPRDKTIPVDACSVIRLYAPEKES